MRKPIQACVAMLMSALLIIGMCLPVSALTDDYTGHWAGETLAKWVDLGFLKADAKGNLQPNEAITRGRFMSLVNKVMGYTEPSGKIKDFTDIPADSPYYRDADIALGAGYISGTSATTMNPEGLITREQIMTIFCRNAGLDTGASDSGILNAAKDSGKVSGWAKEYIAAAIQNGYLAGDNGNIKPLQNITLGEAAVLLDRVYTGTHVYAFPWTYGPAKNPVKMNNVIILGSGVKLQNIIVSNSLSIDKNTAISGISLYNVTVNGVMNVEGSGLETLSLQGGSINELNLQGANISIAPSGGAIIAKLIVNGKNAAISLAKDCIIRLAEIKASARFTGDGTIEKAIVSAKDVEFSKKPNAVSTTGNGSYTITGVTPSTPEASKDRDKSSSDGEDTHNISVTGVNLNNDTLNLTAGGATATLKATFTPANATNRSVTWSSSSPAVATVVNGVVTPVSAGSTVITVKTMDGGFTDTCTVNVAASVVSVTGVRMDRDTLSLKAGGAVGTLTATVSPNNATNKNVTWSSSVPAVATVANGVVTPVSAGSTVITVTTADGGFTDTCAVTIAASVVSVTGVSLDTDTLSLKAGSAAGTLTATVSPADATNKKVSWSSSAPTVAEVVYGVVTPLTIGNATITVITEDGGYTDTCEVTVIDYTIPVTGVSLDSNTLSLTAGGATGTLAATVSPANATNRNVTWSSSAPAVATVVNGVITPLTPGITTITVTTEDGGYTDTCTVTVTASVVSVTGVSLDRDTLSLTAGGAAGTLTATVSPANATNKNVTWSSSAPAVATVANGVVTPVSTGSTVITVTTADGGFTDTCEVTVIDSTIPVTGVSLNSNTLNLTAGGDTGTLKATVSPSDATYKSVTWSSSAPAIATVANGVVTPVSAGSTTITVTTVDGGFTDTCTVNVAASAVSVTGVSLDRDTLNLTAGGAVATLTATISPVNATNKNVTWSSSAPAVATVVNGVVTPVSAGSAIITVTTQDENKTASCNVTITAAVPATGITLNASYVQALAGGPAITLIGTVAPAEATDKNIVWSSSDQSVAKVDSNGKVTPLAKGTTTITAKTHNDLTDTCEIEVKEAAASLSFVSDEGTSIAPAIATGAHINIVPKTTPANAYLDLKWKSGNVSVAAVDENTGEVTGVSTGTATITATNHNGVAASYTITVKPALTNVTLPSTATVPFKGSVPLTVTLAPSGALGEYVLESSNSSIAYVDKDNNLIGVSAGTAIIRAKIGSVTKSTCTVTVSAPVAAGVTPSLEYISTAYIAPGTDSDLELGIVPSSSTEATHYLISYHSGYSTDLTKLFTDYYEWGASVVKTTSSIVLTVPTGVAIVSIYAYKDSNSNGSPDAGEQIGDVTVGRYAALPRIRNVSAGGVAFSMYLGGFPGMLYFLDPISGGFYFDDMDGADGYYMYIVKEGELWGTYQWMKDSPTDRVGLVTKGFVDFHPETPSGPAGYKVPMERLDFQSGNYTFYIIPYVCDPAYARDHSDTSKLIMGNMFITNLQLSSIGTNNWIFDNE